MSAHLFRSRHRRLVVGIALPLWLAGMSLAACAQSSDGTSATPDVSVIVPSNDASAEAAPDATVDGDADSALPDMPCAVGNVCRVTTALTVGYVSSIQGRSTSDVWAAGSLGLMMHWDGHGWTDIRSTKPPSDLLTPSSVFLTPDAAWGIAGTRIMRRGLDPDSIHTFELFDPYHAPTSVVVLGNGHGYIGCSEGPYAPPGAGGVLYDVFDFDNAAFRPLPPPVLAANQQPVAMNIRALFAAPESAMWAVGERGLIARYSLAGADAGPTQGEIVPLANQNDLFAGWGAGDELWAAGEKGTLIHVDGTSTTAMTSSTTATLNAIFGLSKSDIWAAGDNGVLLHFDGTSWSRIPIQGYRGNLRTIWGAASDDVWIGGEGAMFHWGPLP